MSKSLNISRAELEEAPDRATWNMTSAYDGVYLLPSRKKHDSGWHLIQIIGHVGDKLEKAAWCDDVCWKVKAGGYDSMRSDMTFPGGVMHFWGARFTVGVSLSSTNITVEPA